MSLHECRRASKHTRTYLRIPHTLIPHTLIPHTLIPHNGQFFDLSFEYFFFQIFFFDQMEGIEAHSWICARVLRRHFMFQLINVFLGVAISTGMLSVAIEFADHPTSLAQILGVYVCVSLYVCIHVSLYVYISLHVYLCVCPCGQEQQTFFFYFFISNVCSCLCPYMSLLVSSYQASPCQGQQTSSSTTCACRR